jgi:methylenetetrahydrofolate--tRNA-(uracil-5-)-methyltransferase
MEITVIGGGLAGTEAAYQIAIRGHKVRLFEMRPEVFTAAHKTPYLSELVCSNSLKSVDLTNAHGLLKEELRRLEALTMKRADEAAIPGGKALVVDRERFARAITEEIEAHPLIKVVRGEVTEVPPGIVIVATGPLTSPAFTERLQQLTGADSLYFFDAISPIIHGETIDMENAFFGARYQDRRDDYLNCPLTQEEYERFYGALIGGERVRTREFEKAPYFEGCLPVEVMAQRGKETLLFGPMKPVGLRNRRSLGELYAVVQLRRENDSGTMYNMVGFQTKLTYAEQERVFRLIPALRKATFLRFGSVHRNTYINSPSLLDKSLKLIGDRSIYFAGQITGVEGYVESTAMGVVAAIAACCFAQGKPFLPPPDITCTGALLRYITTERKDFQPMNVNFGLLTGYRKKEKARVIAGALSSLSAWKQALDKDIPRVVRAQLDT